MPSFVSRSITIRAFITVSPPVANGEGANRTALCVGNATLGDISYPISLIGSVAAIQAFYAAHNSEMPMLINAVVTSNIDLLACPSQVLPLNETEAATVRDQASTTSALLMDIQQLDPNELATYADSAAMLSAVGVLDGVAIHMKRSLLLKLTLQVQGVNVTVKAFDPSDNICQILTGLLKQDLIHMMESANSEREIENLTQHANTRIGSHMTIIGRVLKETYTNDQGTELSSFVFRASNRHNITISTISDDEDETDELPVPASAASASATSSTSTSSSSAGMAHVD